MARLVDDTYVRSFEATHPPGRAKEVLEYLESIWACLKHLEEVSAWERSLSDILSPDKPGQSVEEDVAEYGTTASWRWAHGYGRGIPPVVPGHPRRALCVATHEPGTQR